MLQATPQATPWKATRQPPTQDKLALSDYGCQAERHFQAIINSNKRQNVKLTDRRTAVKSPQIVQIEWMGFGFSFGVL